MMTVKSARLKLSSDYAIRFGHFWIVVLAIYWIALFLVSPKAVTKAGIYALICTIGLSLAVTGWRLGRALANGSRVLGSLQTPCTLWRAWMKTAWVGAAARWGLAVVAGTLALALNETAWSWSSAASLYSTLMILGLVAALSYYGVWHWAWAVGIAMLAGVFSSTLGWSGLDQLMRSSPAWQLPFAFCWPALSLILLRRWRERPLQRIAAGERSSFNPWRVCADYARRFTLLKLPMRGQSQANTLSAWINVMTQIVTQIFYLPILSASFERCQWGDHVGFLHAVLLAVLAAAFGHTIVCKDLHWRRLLAPNGFRHGRLGWHLFASTLTVWAFVALVVALLWVAFSWQVLGVTPVHNLYTAIHYAVLPLELIFLLSVAIALRAFGRPWLTYTVAFMGLLTAGLVYCWIVRDRALAPWFEIGPAYVGCLLVLTALFIALANRLWTTQRLLPYIVSGAKPTDNAIEGGRWFNWLGSLGKLHADSESD